MNSKCTMLSLKLCIVFLSVATVSVHASLKLRRFESAAAVSTARQHHPYAEVSVPHGWKVLSGGALVRFYGAGQLLTKSYPLLSGGSKTPHGWRVASKDHSTADLGQIQAYAIALYDPYNHYDVYTASYTTTYLQAHPRATAYLPSGYKLLGGGVNVHWRGHGNLMVTSRPTDSLNGWIGSSKDHLVSDPSIITVYAIGIRHKTGAVSLYTRMVTAVSSKTAHPSASARASHGYAIVGGGAEVNRGGIGNMLVNLIPDFHGRSFFASAKDHLHSDPRILTTYGIEVKAAKYI